MSLPDSHTAPAAAASPNRGDGAARLLLVGDVHLGRSPGGLPPGVEAAPYGPRAALGAAVELALSEGVDAVLFAGDVVDAARDFFEAYAPLAAAARRLVAAGIEVSCVAGNHDVQVLPRLVEEVPGVRLLGAGGRWESHVVRRRGTPVARVLGWSFPRPRVLESPLASLDSTRLADAPAGVPTVGLLHADLDAAGSHYAPVARRALEAVAGVDAWFLGHVHAPSDLAGARPIGYLGSLTALDPGAVGPRGPWLVEAGRAGVVARHRATSPLRFERVDLDVSGARTAEALEEQLARTVRETGDRVAASEAEARLLGARVRLVGRTPVRRVERARIVADALRGLGAIDAGEGGTYLEGVEDEALPAVDLASLARNSDPLGLVARRVLALQAGDEEGRRLVRRALPALRARAEHATFTTYLGELPLDDARAREVLLDAGRRTLEALLAQRPDVLEHHAGDGRAATLPAGVHQEPFVFEADGEAGGS